MAPAHDLANLYILNNILIRYLWRFFSGSNDDFEIRYTGTSMGTVDRFEYIGSVHGISFFQLF
jgi:hypothetical protein